MACHWPKPFHASAARVFPKPASKVGDPPCAMGRCRLDAFSNRPFHVHICDLSAVCKIQNMRIRSLRLISILNLVRGRTTHLKESKLDPFVPGQIQMTRKHNHRFSKRPRNVHTKVGFKNDGIRIVLLVIRDSIRPSIQISKHNSGAMLTLVQQICYRNHFLHTLVSKLDIFGQKNETGFRQK
ncbi:hypothetical protein TNCV_1785221 [Trichonephila clavipes]|nr:hypothetical protein TNCV_1785221 [Trichonephila clavipes]